ncbi:CDP-glycerol glycerophosphotransferase family protein [uncultured Psychrobacter sp.]|uniref:CDP-glycerol glycerophosphotransferase family protein n=1 Tax=uncultured Psychrobacter sp. TaxID=259303 RepID=UPI0034573FB9
MSKLTKLVNNPKQFFWDVRPVRVVRNALPFEIVMTGGETKKTQAKSELLLKKKKQLAKQSVVADLVQIKNSLQSLINDVPVSNIDLKNYQVALYFSGGIGSIYQVEQWLSTLKVLNKQAPIVIITRVKAVFEWLTYNTEFVVVYCRTIQDLTDLYERSDFKCILYANHGYKNFQSLMNQKALHIHINHGESDKTSTITNQAKSYDYVYVVAQAGYDKYEKNLIKKDMRKYIKVGRPQLENIPQRDKFKTDKTVVLYAPTWEGTHESMNFSSLQEFELSMVEQLMKNSDCFVVYKPHPNTGSRDANIKNINEAIIKMLDEYEHGEVILSGDINSIYSHVDICVFDNSAVAIDYLKLDKPMLMTDMFHRVKGRVDKPIITGAARMIKPLDAINIVSIIREELELDTRKIERQKIKQYFLGDFDYENGESTDTFVTQVLEACKERDMLLEGIASDSSDDN